MEKAKKPSKLIAILSTIAATCFLLSFILIIIDGKRSTGLMVFQGFTSVLLTIAAVGNWFQYIERYVQYEVQKKLNEEKSNNKN
jgi:hypothetical protein